MALGALEETCDYLPAKTGVKREVGDAITALRQALAPRHERIPKKLGAKDQEILVYCSRPRTSLEIALHIRCTMSGIYHHLRLLQRLGLLEKHQAPGATGHNHGVTFQSTGKSIEAGWDNEYMRYQPKGEMIMGVRV